MFQFQSNLLKNIFFIICSGLLLVGCQPLARDSIEPIIITRTATNNQEASSLSEPMGTTYLPAKSTTIMSTPTLTMISTETSPPISTPTPLFIPIVTPLPTVPPNEVADKVLSLLSDNHNPDCLLPCWWGATPGQTYWQDIESFLSSFAVIFDTSTSTSNGAEIIISLPESSSLSNNTYSIFYGWNESGIIQGISTQSLNISGYDPTTLMGLYGIPDEVWLRTYDGLLPGDVLPFQLIVVYQQQGISFHYYVNASIDGEIVTACFEPGVVEEERPDLFPAGPRISLWEPGTYKTIGEIANIPRGIYLPLEDTTDLTPQTFYEKFTNPEKQPCIDTPAHFWGF